MSHSRFRFLCRWWYHDQIGRNHDCRWSDRLNDKHDHFLLRDHLSGCRTQKGNTLREKKITRRHLVWVFAVVAVIVGIVVVLFSIACVTEAQTGGEGWRGGGGESVKGKRERSRIMFTSTEPLDQVFRLLFSYSSLHLLKNKKFHGGFTHKSNCPGFFRTNCLLQVCSLP